MSLTFFDLLGIDPGALDPAGQAAARWPLDIASFTRGLGVDVTPATALPIVTSLQAGLAFTNVRPGVDPGATLGDGPPGQFAFAADMTVSGLAASQPFYLRALPDHGIQLHATVQPAEVFFAADGRGYEVIIDKLPVTILLKPGLATPSGLVTSAGMFDASKLDSIAYRLAADPEPTQIDCFIRLHLTTEGDVILEPSVPVSLGPVRWMGFPATAVYDLQFLPSPNRRDYLEWARNDVGSFFAKPPAKGAIGFRSIDVDFSTPPFSDLKAWMQRGKVNLGDIEIVLEDVVLPATVPGLPIPSHGAFGFRRKITDRTDLAKAYDYAQAPLQVPIYGSPQQGGNGGSALTLQVESFLFRTGDGDALNPEDFPQFLLKAELLFQTESGGRWGPTLDVDDQWTLTAGVVANPATTPLKLVIVDTTIGLAGFRFGVSMGRLARGIPFSDSFKALFDFSVTSKPSASDGGVFTLRSMSGKELTVVLRDVGYKFGNLSADGLQMPDGMQLVFADTVTIILQEMGYLEEPSGTPYFSFSGGIALGSGGGKAITPNGAGSDLSGNGFGVTVRRLRFRLNGDTSQPPVKLDGAYLMLDYGPVQVAGFGYVSEYTDSGWSVKEFGFGVKVAIEFMATSFSLAAEFIKGHRVATGPPPTQEFGYFLAWLVLGKLPAGPIELVNMRALVADNMAPNLDAQFPDGEGMALLKWHLSHDNALTVPANRTLADWVAEKGASALGVGCGLSFGCCGDLAHLEVFIFSAKSNADTGLLIVGALYLLKDPKSIAFVAIEYDINTEKFGIMAGVSLTLADLTSGNIPDWLAKIAVLSLNPPTEF